jgi:N-acetylneuraminic acid mutarotase
MKLVITLLFSFELLSAQVWVQLPDYPDLKRDDGVAVVVGNNAYFGTGLIEYALTIDFHILNLSNFTWETMPYMPHGTQRQYACAFAGNNSFYVFGGDGVGGALNNMQKYDIATSTWATATSKPGSGISGASCMNFGDKVIISGGKFQNGMASAEVWEYTISTDSWAQKNNYPFAGRWRASAAVHNGFGFLIFGRDTGGVYCKDFYKYTPVTDSWNKIMDFPQSFGRAYAALHEANGELFVFGGHDSLDRFYKDIWYFKDASSTWVQGPDLPAVGRRGGMSCTYQDRFFYSCGLGEGSARLTETWMTDIPVGIKENYLLNTFSIYPNPVNSMLTIETPKQNFEDLNCNYEDLFGRTLGNLRPINSSDFDLSELSPGIYIFKFYSENKLIGVKKIVKN